MDYEAEYNNRRRVPEHPAILEAWARDAAVWRSAAHRVETGVSYGPREAEALDIFFPETERPDAPLALFIHGGYWQALDRHRFSHMARGLNAHGFTVAVVGYDLCPNVPLATIVDQMDAACRFLWHRFRRPVLAYGHSAGGHLAAALVATRFAGDGVPAALVPAALSVSGLFDLAPLLETSVNAALGLDAAEAARLSPLSWPAPAGRRIVAAVGGAESDEYLRQSWTLVETWAAAGVNAAYCEIPGANHFTVIDGLADPDSPLVADLVRLAG